MKNMTIPDVFVRLLNQGSIEEKDILNTKDGFHTVFKSVSDILAVHHIMDFPGSDGGTLMCDRFFDDWYLYAVPDESDYVYSLFKLREQEFDAQEEIPADGDTPGSTVSFIEFQTEILMNCLKDPTNENRRKMSIEINRVVAYRKQSHHEALKTYFLNPASEGAYLVASLYVKHIASFVKDGFIEVPERYKEIVKECRRKKNSGKTERIPRFIDSLNEMAGYEVCDHEKIYIRDKNQLTGYEKAAVLAVHTGNESFHSFAAEVEFHAKFLVSPARIRVPVLGRSIYDSAIRADLSIDDSEFEGPAPYHKADSKIVTRQRQLHKEYELFAKEEQEK